MQAESAASLADIAQDDKQGNSLCTPEAFQVCKKLLQSDRTDIAYPAARMLKSLATYPESAQCFADDNIVPMILEKVRSERTCRLVRQRLARTLDAAIPRCAASLTEQVIAEVAEALQGAILDDGHADPTRDDQQEAPEALGNSRREAWSLQPAAGNE